MKKILVISDTQCPYENKRGVASLCNFMADFQPDLVLHVGDDIDSPETSRWNKNLAGEYADTLQKAFRATHNMHQLFRDAMGASTPYHVMRSNHGDRTETYVRKYAPALVGLECLRIEELIGYEDLDITYHRRPYEFTPGWLLCHGDEAGLSQIPGSTAMGLARLTGKSVVCGHSHKQGLQHLTTGVNGHTRTRFGVEVGNLMDIRKAQYLATGSANWQAGFGILYQDGVDVYPYVVPMKPDGSFICGGRKYKA